MKLADGIIVISVEDFISIIKKEDNALIVISKHKKWLGREKYHYLTKANDFIFSTQSSQALDFNNSIEIIASTSRIYLVNSWTYIPLFFNWLIWVTPELFLEKVSTLEKKIIYKKSSWRSKKYTYFVNYKGFILAMKSEQTNNFPSSIEVINVQTVKLPRFATLHDL